MKVKDFNLLHAKTKIEQTASFRIACLKKMKHNILLYEEAIKKALLKDLNKSFKETYLCEINEVLEEIDYHIKHLKKWVKPRKVKSTYQTFNCKSFIHSIPRGKVLLIVPFNYPFNLCFMPLIGIISAGNQAIIKMSSSTPNINKVIKQIIKATFSIHHIGFIDQNMIKNYDELFDYEPDFVFFTGSSVVGAQIAKKCVENKINYITELGGQSPCLVLHETNNIYQRIVWAKFLNAGQTCITLNHILYNNDIKTFETNLINEIKKQYPDPIKNKNIPKIINQKNFDRLVNILKQQHNNIIYGGKYDKKTLIIEPTVIRAKSLSDIKQYGEIFGPIIFIYEKHGTNLIDYTNDANFIDNSPLAAYLYSQNKSDFNNFFNNINAGGYCINDAITHILNHHLPFGGVKNSGFGSYHGKFSFDSLSYKKPVVINKSKKDFNIKFINNDIQLNRIKRYLKIIKCFIK